MTEARKYKSVLTTTLAELTDIRDKLNIRISEIREAISEISETELEARSTISKTQRRILELVAENPEGVPISEVYRRCQAWHKLRKKEREQVLNDLENSGKIVLRRSTPDGGLGRSITRIYPPEDY